MSARPDIDTLLQPGETLLWQGHPMRGRPTAGRANLLASLAYVLTFACGLTAWYFGIYRFYEPGTKLIVYALIATAAFATYWGLRITWLATRRARARDARTAYAITDRRALTLAGPYDAEVALGPTVTVTLREIPRSRGKLSQLVITGDKGALTFDRLADAAAARDTLMAQIRSAT